jgi:outer membrane lipoprotein carrier protein
MTGCVTEKRVAFGNWNGFRRSMWNIFALVMLACVTPLYAADAPSNIDIPRTLKGVEDRYNGAKTLQLSFSETYKQQNRQLIEKGELFLRKPGRMRWQYTMPAGKLFVSDGKFIYSYIPLENRAEKNKLKETEDMRAPLAFLLGQLEFKKDFREFHARPEGDGVFITAIPKSDKMPYTEVAFLVGPNSTIRRLEVKGQDNSLLIFSFDDEKKDPPVADSQFHFTPPPGVEYVDLSNQ